MGWWVVTLKSASALNCFHVTIFHNHRTGAAHSIHSQLKEHHLLLCSPLTFLVIIYWSNVRYTIVHIQKIQYQCTPSFTMLLYKCDHYISLDLQWQLNCLNMWLNHCLTKTCKTWMQQAVGTVFKPWYQDNRDKDSEYERERFSVRSTPSLMFGR